MSSSDWGWPAKCYDAIAVEGHTCTCTGEDGEPRPLAVHLPRPCIGEDDRSYVGDAVCPWPDCRRVVGRMVVEVETLFGVEEDRAVLYGRARVYG